MSPRIVARVTHAWPAHDPAIHKANPMKDALTDRSIAKLVPPERGRLEVLDMTMPGLAIRVAPSERKSWMVVTSRHVVELASARFMDVVEIDLLEKVACRRGEGVRR